MLLGEVARILLSIVLPTRYVYVLRRCGRYWYSGATVFAVVCLVSGTWYLALGTLLFVLGTWLAVLYHITNPQSPSASQATYHNSPSKPTSLLTSHYRPHLPFPCSFPFPLPLSYLYHRPTLAQTPRSAALDPNPPRRTAQQGTGVRRIDISTHRTPLVSPLIPPDSNFEFRISIPSPRPPTLIGHWQFGLFHHAGLLQTPSPSWPLPSGPPTPYPVLISLPPTVSPPPTTPYLRQSRERDLRKN